MNTIIFRMKSIAGIIMVCTIIILLTGCISPGMDGISEQVGDDVIIHLNAKTSTLENPVAFDFAAGTYDVTVIGIDEGGAYDAWRFWILKNGWISKYSLFSSEFSTVTYTDGIGYENPSLALAHAVNSMFTLENDSTVYFFVSDSPYWDNFGGISLKVLKVSVL